MTLLEKIQQSQSKEELDLLNMEIILNQEHFPENQRAFISKLKELENEA